MFRYTESGDIEPQDFEHQPFLVKQDSVFQYATGQMASLKLSSELPPPPPRDEVQKRNLRLNISKQHVDLYEWIIVQYDAIYNSHYPFEFEVQWKSVSGY